MKSFAMLIPEMDKGNGFLDRFIISVPKCFRPTPQEQIQAQQVVERTRVDIEDLYTTLLTSLDEDNPTLFYLDEDSAK